MPRYAKLCVGGLLMALCYFVFAYQNIWYLDHQTAIKLKVLFAAPMILILLAWFFYPSIIAVGLLAILAFLLPTLASEFDFPWQLGLVEATLVAGLMGITASISKNYKTKKFFKNTK